LVFKSVSEDTFQADVKNLTISVGPREGRICKGGDMEDKWHESPVGGLGSAEGVERRAQGDGSSERGTAHEPKALCRTLFQFNPLKPRGHYIYHLL
jgi:hypothetical protein